MSDSELKETQPTATVEQPQSSPVKNDAQPRPPAGKFPRWLAALVVVLLIVIGVLGGYGSGMGERYSAQKTLITGQNQDQYNLGVQAVNAGQYELARQYFDFVIQHDPNFPGIQAAYADLLLRLQISPTPTFTETPVATATPDQRSAEEKFNSASQLLSAAADNLCARDWAAIIATLDSLRKVDPNYRAAEVDGMYYITLRNRGMCKIYPQGYSANNIPCSELNVNLEGGIYDLTMAEHFVGDGKLDSQADSMRTYARLYIIGASFWGQDWKQAQYFFGQVLAAYPNISSSPCDPAYSASRRWHDATITYADQLLAAGDFCSAQVQYESALALNFPPDATAFPTATEIADQCNAIGGMTPTPTETPNQ